MTKINKFNFTIMYIGQNEKVTVSGIEPQNPKSRHRRLSHYTMIVWELSDKKMIII